MARPTAKIIQSVGANAIRNKLANPPTVTTAANPKPTVVGHGPVGVPASLRASRTPSITARKCQREKEEDRRNKHICELLCRLIGFTQLPSFERLAQYYLKVGTLAAFPMSKRNTCAQPTPPPASKPHWQVKSQAGGASVGLCSRQTGARVAEDGKLVAVGPTLCQAHCVAHARAIVDPQLMEYPANLSGRNPQNQPLDAAAAPGTARPEGARPTRDSP